MNASRKPAPGLRSRLEHLIATHDVAGRLAADPVGLVHPYTERGDREVAALVASSLAFGNAVAIRRSVSRVLGALGPSPARTLARSDEHDLERRLGGFVHRVYRGPDVARMLSRAGRIRRSHGSIGALMKEIHHETDGDLRESLARLSDRLRGPEPSRGLGHLIPNPRAGSAVKRLLLWLRWMVRPEDGVDLGLWPLDPAILIIPVDTHVLRISWNLGLTNRRSADWRTACEITEHLRRFDPEDPVKYDFALCHLGVSRECPSRPDRVLCGKCVLQRVCSVWKPAQASSRNAGTR